MYFVIFLLCIVACCQAQIPGTGPCRDVPGMANFDPSRVLGEWFGYGTYHDCRDWGRCKRTEFIGLGDGSMIDDEIQLSIVPDTFEVEHLVRELTYVGNATYLTTKPLDSEYFDDKLIFWDTDYVSYFVKGSCANSGNSSLHYLWASTRTQHPSPSVIAKIDEVLQNLGMPKQYMYIYNQTGCPHDF